MANLKSSKKDLRRIAKRRERNLATKSALKTYVKKVKQAPDAAAAVEALKKAVSALDKASEHGFIHKNQASRRKSRAAKAANKLISAAK